MSDARPGLGLQAKLLAVTGGLAIASFAAVWWIATDTSRGALIALSDQNLSLSADNLARALDATIADTRADARTTARLDLSAEPIDSGDPKNFEWYADELVQSKPKYAAIVVTDAEGTVVGANTVDSSGAELEGRSPMGRRIEASWLTAALAAEAGAPTWVPPSRPAALDGVLREGEQVFGFSLPVFDILDDRIGAVTLFVSVDHLAGLLDGYVTRVDGRLDSLALVVTADGRTVVAPRQELPAGFADARVHAEEVATFTAAGGEWYRALGHPVAGAEGWRVAQLQHLESFDAQIAPLSRTLVWTFVVAGILVVLGLGFVSARFLGPLRRLTDAIGRTTKASEFAALPVETTDEVGALTRTFNRIFGTLKDYEQGLEDKVAERTRELAAAKQEVQDILDNIAQGIFTIGADRLVGREFSRHCEALFGDVDIAGADALSLLGLPAGSPSHKSMRFWLDTVLGGNQLQWTLSGGGPIAELSYTAPGADEAKVLRLEYAPIYVDRTVDRVMVIARDMTAVVKLQQEVERKDSENRENIARVAELAQLDPDLFETFLVEAGQILGRCRGALSSLRSDHADRASIDELFRGMHTLKANARIFKMTSIQDVAHAAEDHFQRVRDGDREVTDDALRELEEQLDRVQGKLREYEGLGRRVLLGGAGGHAEALERGRPILLALEELAGRLPDDVVRAEESSERGALTTDAERLGELADRAAALSMTHLAAAIAAVAGPLEAGDDAAALTAAVALRERCAVQGAADAEIGRVPNAQAFLDEASPLLESVAALVAPARESADRVHALLGAAHSLKAHARSFGVRAVAELVHELEDRIATLRDEGRTLGPDDADDVGERLSTVQAIVEDAVGRLSAAAAAGGTPRRGGASLRVPTARIMEVRRMAKEVARALESGAPPEALRTSYAQLDAAVRELTVVPLDDLFERFRKMVLDLSIEVGKPVADLAVEGGDITVDTKLVEKMRDVLNHALRNAVDHGIEPAGQRPDHKPEKGTISVRCFWRDEDLIVEVTDDGRGIDLEAVRRKAVQKRLLDGERAEEAGEEELLELLFSAGFTTAERVTDLSGRGVGLDVIRSTMLGLKGGAEIRSTRGEGTTLSLWIPADYYQQL